MLLLLFFIKILTKKFILSCLIILNKAEKFINLEKLFID